MKKLPQIVGIAGLCLLFSIRLIAGTSAQTFDSANKAYENSDYEEAAGLYESLIPRTQSAATHYNLGNTFYQLKDYPRAILQFQKALAITPANPEIRANLKLAQEALQLQPIELSWIESVSVKMNVNAWTGVAAISFWVGLALIILPSLWGWRGPLKSGLTALCMIMFIVSAIALAGYHGLGKLGVATSDEAALQIAPTSTSPTKEYLKSGEGAAIERKHGDFFFVKTNNGKEGWVDSSNFKPVWD